MVRGKAERAVQELHDLLTEAIGICHDANRHGYIKAHDAFDQLEPRLWAALERVQRM